MTNQFASFLYYSILLSALALGAVLVSQPIY